MSSTSLYFQSFFQNKFQKAGFSLMNVSFFAIIFLLLTAQIFAVGGGVDPTFNAGATNFNSQSVEAITVQTDGRILIGGEFETVGGVRRNRIARLNADGTVDASFNPPGGANNSIYAIAVQPDGRIIVGGSFSNINGANKSFIARLNADGTNDSTFNALGLNSTVHSIAVEQDGKIVIAGSFYAPNAARVARLNSDGSFDTGFSANLGSGANNIVYTVALDADDKILLGGVFTQVSGAAANRIARLNQNGTLDTSFVAGSGANNVVYKILVQSNGKILLGGSFSSFNGTAKNNLARLDADGTLDSSFNTGTGPNSTVYAIETQPDGKILVGGVFNTFNNQTRYYFARIGENGSLDAAYAPPTISGSFVKALRRQLTGEIIVGGAFSAAGNAPRTSIAQFDVTAALDADFATIIGQTGTIYAMAIQTDGKIVIGGSFVGVNDKFRTRIARINADGTLDETFNTGSGANGNVTAIALQSGGKIVIGGAFTSINGITRNHLARLNSDGSLDPNFNVNLNGSLESIVVQPDGKILVAGSFNTINGDPSRKYLFRLNNDGTIDAGFAANNYNSYIETVGLQSGGKIVIAGAFTVIGGAGYARLARLNSDGTIDSTFNAGAGADSIPRSLIVLANDKIVIGGDFTQVGGTNRARLARLNADGSVDTTFNVGTGTNGTVETIAEQADGKLLIGGSFTQYNSLSRSRIARVNTDGSLDVSFDPGTGANGDVYAAALTSDGRIMLGGAFNTINNISRIALARLLAGGTSVWTGAADSNFQNPANWSDNLVPSNADSAEIPANTANQPILGGVASLTNLQINPNANFTIGSGASLDLQGLGNSGLLQGAGTLNLNGAAFINSGTISVSTVNFAGDGVKTLGGTGVFAGNVVNINPGVRLRLDDNHTFSQIIIASGAAFDITSRTVRLTASGAALGGTGGLDANFSTVIYAGTQVQTIEFSQFTNLTIDNPAGVSLGRTVSVFGTLSLENGILTTGTYSLSMLANSAATRTKGFVGGKVQKAFNAGQSFTFPVGNSNGYSPVTISNVQDSVNFAVQANDGFLGGTDQMKSLNTNWTISANGAVQADLTLQYPQSSVPAGANEANFKFIRRSGSTNTEFTPTSFDTNSNIFTLTGVSEFSDWTLGNNLAPTAASVAIGGRALDGNRGIGGVRVTLTNSAGETRSTQTSSFGFYRFDDIPVGATYIISAASKRYIFRNPAQVILVNEELTNIDFNTLPNDRGGNIISPEVFKSSGGKKQ